jgi:hypothetical protein
MRRNILRLLLIVASTLSALLFGEAAFRILNKPRPAVSGWRALVEIGPAEKNQLGYRGQPIEYRDDDFVILLVGDSQVEARACAFERTPEQRLQSHLNSEGRAVRVFSVGASGYGQDQELLALREYFRRYRADLVILWETPLNDIWNNVFPTSWPADGTSKPTFWLEEEGRVLRGPSEGIGEPIRETPSLRLLLLWRKNFGWSRDREWERVYPPAYRPLDEFEGPFREDWQQWWNANERGMRDENLSNEKAHLAVFLTPRSERMQYGLDLTHRLLQEMERLASSRGGRFVTFATSAHGSEETSHTEGVHVLNGKYYRTSQSQYEENLKYLNRGFDFRRVPVTVEQWKAGPTDPHLNEQATDQVMGDLAKQLAPLVPPKD